MSKYLGSSGHYLTKGLFYEFRHQNTDSVNEVFTYGEQDIEKDGKTYLSMYKIYMEFESEYEAAQAILGSWTHWQKLCECAWFKPHLKKWREEREIRESAMGKAALIKEARKGSVAAAKALVDYANKRGAGRPSKQEKANQLKREVSEDKLIKEEIERITSH